MSFFKRLIATYVGPYLKAHAAGLGAGITALSVDTNGNASALGSLTLNQWLGALAATGLLGGFVGLLGNRPAPVLSDPLGGVLPEVAPAPVAAQDSPDAPAAA